MTNSSHPDAENWRALNRANWNERVPIHRAVPFYHRERLKHPGVRMNPIEEAELGSVAGLRLLHLQCHFGHDSLILASRGADVTGLDFSAPAIEAAREDAAALGIAARFVLSDIYDARAAISEPGSFDVVYTTWGTICWLPDITEWARIIAHFMRPGGRLYFADMHPAAYVFDDAVAGSDGMPGWFAAYSERQPLVIDQPRDYADPLARLANQRTVQWMHPLADIVGGLLGAGLRLDWLHEHESVAWRAFARLVQTAAGDWKWPDRPWIPLALSIQMTKPLDR